jgi:hypothetical protein
MYPQDMVTPMQAELASGFQDLHSAEAVENAESRRYNASCSELCMWLRCKKCTSGAKMSLEGQKTRSLITVLQELIKMCRRCKTAHVPFSSIITSYGLIQKTVVHMLERHHGRPAELIAENLQDA